MKIIAHREDTCEGNHFRFIEERYNLFWDKTIKTEENGVWYRKVRQKEMMKPSCYIVSFFVTK